MYNAVSGAVVTGGVAAVEAVAGRVSRLMEVAQVSGGPRAMQALTPTVLGMIGRSLIEWGESLHMLKYRVGLAGSSFICARRSTTGRSTAAPTRKRGSWTPH